MSQRMSALITDPRQETPRKMQRSIPAVWQTAFGNPRHGPLSRLPIVTVGANMMPASQHGSRWCQHDAGTNSYDLLSTETIMMLALAS